VERPRTLYWGADAVIGVSRVALEAALCGVPVILAGDEGALGLLSPSILPRAMESNFCCRNEGAATEELLLSSISELYSMTQAEKSSLCGELIRRLSTDCSIDAVADKTMFVYRRVLREFASTHAPSILLCGYYGYGNLGDHALLRAAVARARADAPTASISAITAHGAKDEPLFGVPCIKRRHIGLLLKRIRTADLFVFGGGTLLQDRTSLRSLCYYTFLLRTAALHGARIELWANGISPPRSRLAKHLIRRALLSCHHIGLRDTASLLLARSLCGDDAERSIVFEEDLALHTEPSDEARIRFLLRHYALLAEGGNCHRFAIVIPRAKEALGQRRIFTWWIKRLIPQNVRLLVLPLFPKEDLYFCQTLAKELAAPLVTGLSEQDLVGLMCHAELVASMRLHGLIFASAPKTPFVGFGEDPKIESFCKEYGGTYWTERL
jgi:polysaccharide pyruvyl transferase CsaB